MEGPHGGDRKSHDVVHRNHKRSQELPARAPQHAAHHRVHAVECDGEGHEEEGLDGDVDHLQIRCEYSHYVEAADEQQQRCEDARHHSHGNCDLRRSPRTPRVARPQLVRDPHAHCLAEAVRRHERDLDDVESDAHGSHLQLGLRKCPPHEHHDLKRPPLEAQHRRRRHRHLDVPPPPVEHVPREAPPAPRSPGRAVGFPGHVSDVDHKCHGLEGPEERADHGRSFRSKLEMEHHQVEQRGRCDKGCHCDPYSRGDDVLRSQKALAVLRHKDAEQPRDKPPHVLRRHARDLLVLPCQ
mmetsp:Transcript_62760/g.198762  ORF Transcript_62760/g.198762 Transcript_62760/m.198762 type:complete len:297 (-) Transcript_62760:158-1048(-)